jgi:uncharacterized repeat protein (TIGR02543 family)
MEIKEKIGKKSGITLIALVITIIVLLILAGVTIITLTGDNGILTQSQNAKERTIIAEEKEKITLGYNNYKILKIQEESPTLTVQDANVEGEETNGWTITFTETGHVYKLDAEGNINAEKTEAYTIKYELKEEDVTNDNPTQYILGQTLILSNASKDGFAFEGWYLTADYSSDRILSIQEEIFDQIEGDTITLYAKWEEETKVEYFSWSATGETINGFSKEGLTAYENGEIINLIIPKKHNGVDVTTISTSAFSGKDKLKKVYIPTTVATIGVQAFYGATNKRRNNNRRRSNNYRTLRIWKFRD